MILTVNREEKKYETNPGLSNILSKRLLQKVDLTIYLHREPFIKKKPFNDYIKTRMKRYKR